VGVALFKDHPNALFPFCEMDSDQRYYVEQIVQSCLRQYDISSSSPMQKASSSGCNNHVVMQMGGGCILYTDHQGQGQQRGVSPAKKVVRLKARDVFEALCDCIFASTRLGALHHVFMCVCVCVCACNTPCNTWRQGASVIHVCSSLT